MARRKSKKLTPMMQQYWAVKHQYPDDVVFFRMGDFFEMFFDDAKLVSELLGITLTHRNKMDDEPIPMAGVPHHAYRNYVNRLVSEGYTVVICDQVEAASQAKGLVKREVTRIVTPGMVLDPDDLDAKSNHYLAAVFLGRGQHGLALLDMTTGEFRATELQENELLAELQRSSPRELLVSEDQQTHTAVEFWPDNLETTVFKTRESRDFAPQSSYDRLCDVFQVVTLDGFGLTQLKLAIRAAGAILAYVQETQKASLPHIHRLLPYSIQEHMIIDKATTVNLELLESQRERSRKGSLFGLIDQSVTAMGGRKIKRWLMYPLLDVRHIEARLNAVDLFFQSNDLREDIRQLLKQVHDLERLNGKVATSIATPRDIVRIKESLLLVPELNGLLQQVWGEAKSFLGDTGQIDPVDELVDAIHQTLADEPATNFKDGGVIRSGFHEELDELREIAEHGKDKILEMQDEERATTGIQSLKIKYNKVFGYYLEVTKPNLHLVPDHYLRKQTMVNHERFITPELKEFEQKVLGAEERMLQLEQELFEQLRLQVTAFGPQLSKVADLIATLDALVGFAQLSYNNDYCRPEISEDKVMSITEGRHPVVDQMMRAGEFVPNDIEMAHQEVHFVLLTGPNMSGKSTFMRQTALIALMAQIGCFVPARNATIGICDRIFTRVGASDNLVAGQSTFMVEMTETANILHNATSRSLVILDEIGRGTSTFDGISIAWAVAEYLHNKTACRTLFATHYHELAELANELFYFRNMCVAVKEMNDEIVFLHKVIDGASNHSYGIQVGRLAGLPSRLIQRSKKILVGLEQGKLPTHNDLSRKRGKGSKSLENQLSFFAPPAATEPEPSEIEEALREVDINNLSPFQALQLLHEWKQKLDS